MMVKSELTLEQYLNNRIEKALGRPTAIGDFVFLFEGEYVEIDMMFIPVSENCVYMFLDDGWLHVELHGRCPHCGERI